MRHFDFFHANKRVLTGSNHSSLKRTSFKVIIEKQQVVSNGFLLTEDDAKVQSVRIKGILIF